MKPWLYGEETSIPLDGSKVDAETTEKLQVVSLFEEVGRNFYMKLDAESVLPK